MKCEVRNTSSSETYAIPPEGSTFGRAGGPANITISDQSVSKRHARIFMKDGGWFLEDLKSVNGTVVNNRRITEPIAIQPGFTFSLSKHIFEVVALEPNGTRSDPRRGGAGGGGGGGGVPKTNAQPQQQQQQQQQQQRQRPPPQPS